MVFSPLFLSLSFTAREGDYYRDSVYQLLVRMVEYICSTRLLFLCCHGKQGGCEAGRLSGSRGVCREAGLLRRKWVDSGVTADDALSGLECI